MQHTLQHSRLNFFGAYALFAIAIAFVVTYALTSATTAFAATYGNNDYNYNYNNNNYKGNYGYHGWDDQDYTITNYLYIDGQQATTANASNDTFGMNTTVTGPNGSSPVNGQFTFGPSNSPTPYVYKYNNFNAGGNYTTSAVMNNGLGAQCSPYSSNPWNSNHQWNNGVRYALVGYTSGNTLAQAQQASVSSTAPSFTNVNANRHVIVWVHDCAVNSGQIGGDVTGGGNAPLFVTSVIPVDTSAIADGTFENGWKFLFNITAPGNEQDLAMRFADWTRTNGFGVIPVAGNIRISSAQASTSNWSLITGPNIYSTPNLHMVTDLSGIPGRQVQIAVEVAIPNGTPNGAYTTSYGVRSQ
jgi:hypothetical protein